MKRKRKYAVCRSGSDMVISDLTEEEAAFEADRLARFTPGVEFFVAVDAGDHLAIVRHKVRNLYSKVTPPKTTITITVRLNQSDPKTHLQKLLHQLADGLKLHYDDYRLLDACGQEIGQCKISTKDGHETAQ